MVIRPFKDGVTARSRWPTLPIPFDGRVALGNMTQYGIVIVPTKNQPGYLLCLPDQNRCVEVGPGYYTGGYIAEKLDISSGDSGNVADIVNALWCDADVDTQGRYNDCFCISRIDKEK